MEKMEKGRACEYLREGPELREKKIIKRLGVRARYAQRSSEDPFGILMHGCSGECIGYAVRQS